MAGTARELVELAVKVSECKVLAEFYGQREAEFSLEEVVERLMVTALAMEEAEEAEEVGE